MKLPESARKLIEGGAHAHLVTLNPDGTPQVSLVWAMLEGDDILTAHLHPTKKVRNILEDGRVAISFESGSKSEMGLTQYLVVHGLATIEEGGAAERLQQMAHTYMGPAVTFPTMENPPAGFTNRVKVQRISGVGPWTGRDV